MKKIILAALVAAAATGSVWADTYPRKVLVEQFTTIMCPNCPYGDAVLKAATDGREDFVWVAHHIGYYTDELTVDDSNKLTVYGVNFAPGAMISRSFQDQQGKTTRVLNIGYTNASAGGTVIGGYMDNVLATEANVGITLAPEFDEATSKLKVKVDLEKNEDLPAEAVLTVMVAENSVYAKQGQAGAASVHRHNHVYRRSFTDILGDEIDWNGNTYSKEFEMDVPEEWWPSRLYVVAFVNMPYSMTGNAEVLNVEAKQRFTDYTGVTQAPVFSPGAGDYNYRVRVSMEAAPTATIYYTLDGSDPEVGVSSTYTRSVELTETTTVKAIAVEEGRAPSAITEVTYNVETAGIDTIEASAGDAAPEYFDLQGRRVVNPAAGLYLMRRGTEVTKVLIP